jgi:hypothetical protein
MIYVISDTHGNYDGLMKALKKHKIIDKHGNRQLARKHKVISIGDLANCVEKNKMGDINCLSMVGEVIDYMIMGNHEMGYLDSSNTFGGFHWHPEIQHLISTMTEDGRIIPAYMHGALISHAGLSKRIMSVDMSMKEVSSIIWREWADRNYNHSWFSSIGRCRGGLHGCGGILWCDFHEEFFPTSFPQIVGHSSRGRNVKMIGNALCIDVGAKDLDTKPFILEVR